MAFTWRLMRKDARRKFAYHPNPAMRSATYGVNQ